MTPNDFLKIIQDSIHKQYEPVPAGWYSSNDLCKIWNLNPTAVRRRIREGIKFGLIDVKYYFLPRKNKAMHKTPHYKFRKKS